MYSSKFTFLVSQSDGSVKEFCEAKLHLSPNRPQKRNIAYEIYLRKAQSSFSHPSYPLNNQSTPSYNVPQSSFMPSMAPPPPNPPPAFASNSSIPLTQIPYPPNNQTNSSTDDQFPNDFSDVQPDFDSEVAFDPFFDDIDPYQNFDWPQSN